MTTLQLLRCITEYISGGDKIEKILVNFYLALVASCGMTLALNLRETRDRS